MSTFWDAYTRCDAVPMGSGYESVVWKSREPVSACLDPSSVTHGCIVICSVSMMCDSLKVFCCDRISLFHDNGMSLSL